VLPDFREAKEKLERSLMRRISDQVKKPDPVLAMIRTVRQHEGRRHVWSTDQGKERSTGYQPAAAEITINQHETLDWTISDIARQADTIADQMMDQIVPNIFTTLKETTEEVGNVVDAKGEPFSIELFLESIEKVHIDFDEVTGQPHLPTMFVGPKLADRVQTLLPEWDQNAEYKARFDALIAQKKVDWNDRESNRKLVD
jgi:hypothetical protein